MLIFDLVMSASTLNNFIQNANHTGFDSYTYFLLKEGADAKKLEAKFPDLVTKYASGEVLRNFGVSYDEYQKSGNGYIYSLQPLKDIYLNSNLEGELKPPGSINNDLYFYNYCYFHFIYCDYQFYEFGNCKICRKSQRSRHPKNFRLE